TEIVNLHGDVRSTHDRSTTDGTYSSGQTAPCGGADSMSVTNGRYAIICTNVIDIRTPAGSIGQSSPRLNLDLVDSNGNPAPTTFTTGRVNAVLKTIYLGPHSLFTGEEVRYNTAATEIGGLTDNSVYY